MTQENENKTWLKELAEFYGLTVADLLMEYPEEKLKTDYDRLMAEQVFLDAQKED